MSTCDIVLLTDRRYVAPEQPNWYVKNVLEEDRLIGEALQMRGLRVLRTSWDDPGFKWEETEFALFRTTWDYFDRLEEFMEWFGNTRLKTRFINPAEMIMWNIDKHYLVDLNKRGIHVPETIFMEKGDTRNLGQITGTKNWNEMILKPAVSGAARHTYRFTERETGDLENVFCELIANESMLLQEFQRNVIEQGEVAYMVFGGRYSHAVLKIAKPGDFRVQDDFGGTVHEYDPDIEEIRFAEDAVAACDPIPVYARVDVIRDNDNRLAVSELELIEPELWMRRSTSAADAFAEAVLEYIDGMSGNSGV